MPSSKNTLNYKFVLWFESKTFLIKQIWNATKVKSMFLRFSLLLRIVSNNFNPPIENKYHSTIIPHQMINFVHDLL